MLEFLLKERGIEVILEKKTHTAGCLVLWDFSGVCIVAFGV